MSALLLIIAAQTGAISGTVRYTGKQLPSSPVEVDVDGRTCGRGSPITLQDLEVQAGLLANAVVILDMPRDPSAAPGKATLDQQNCVFVPHVQTVTLGSELVVGNSDPIIHNVHARIRDETVFNLGMPLRGVVVKRKLDRAGIHEITCDSGHWWMKAYTVVVPHRFHTTTGIDGGFRIDEVPAGSRHLSIWHERLGRRELELEVRENETTTVEITYDDAPPAREEPPPEPKPEPAGDLEARREQVRREGRSLYLGQCAGCHGEKGDGRGRSAPYLSTAPRDFTKGDFEFRTTPTGSAPSIGDLYRTISLGVPGSEMPAFRRRLSSEQRKLLAEYVASFSRHWIEAHTVEPIAIPEPPPASFAAIRRGRELYVKLKCAQCHGTRGDRSDAEQRRIEAADLTRPYYKGGTGVRVIYRALTTGLSASAMPAFLQITDEERWDLARYVESLGETGAGDWLLDPDVGRRATP